MKHINNFLVLSLFIIFATACKSDSLEEYFVQATESSDFLVVNIPSNFVQFDESKLDDETLKQIKSVKKVNILLFKNDKNKDEKEQEFLKIDQIINSKDYKKLTAINIDGYKISVAYDGEPKKIDKVVFLGKDMDNNFLLGLLKGKDISISNVSKAMEHIKSIDEKQAKSVIDAIK